MQKTNDAFSKAPTGHQGITDKESACLAKTVIKKDGFYYASDGVLCWQPPPAQQGLTTAPHGGLSFSHRYKTLAEHGDKQLFPLRGRQLLAGFVLAISHH